MSVNRTGEAAVALAGAGGVAGAAARPPRQPEILRRIVEEPKRKRTRSPAETGLLGTKRSLVLPIPSAFSPGGFPLAGYFAFSSFRFAFSPSGTRSINAPPGRAGRW